ncbi:MAG: FIST C-terminal domain-containing protein [Steroidobacteraceae bacterium]
MPLMQWASANATESTLSEAVAQAADRLLAALNGAEPDLVMACISSQHQAQFALLGELLRREFETAQLFASLTVSVIGGGRELEDQPAISLVGAVLPGVEIHGIHLEQQNVPPVYAERRLWESALGVGKALPECMLLMADPFSFTTDSFLKGLDRHFPQTQKLGGLVSGVERPGLPCLLLNGQVHTSGCICVTLSGNLKVDVIVAQGCRPIGDPMFANATHENLILALDGKIPREVLTELYEHIKRSDRKLFTDALFIGLAMEQREQYRPGDFLIRTILGLDPDSGALLINTHVPEHSVVQLHLRDAVTSAQELEQLLSHYRNEHDINQISGALLFSCLGRGAEFYGRADHDSNVFKHHIGDLPLGGLFCNGEIGPVRGTTHLHGYTSVFALFRPKP